MFTDFEGTDWGVFFSPFSLELWQSILISVLVITLLKCVIEYAHSKKKLAIMISFFEIFWNTFMANFGGKPIPSNADGRNSYKTLIFCSLLCGLTFWISYRAFLSAQLATQVIEYPFNDLSSLSKSGYK